MMNVIAIFICMTAAIFYAIQGNMGWCVVEILLTALNVPFAIEWIKDNF